MLKVTVRQIVIMVLVSHRVSACVYVRGVQLSLYDRGISKWCRKADSKRSVSYQHFEAGKKI